MLAPARQPLVRERALSDNIVIVRIAVIVFKIGCAQLRNALRTGANFYYRRREPILFQSRHGSMRIVQSPKDFKIRAEDISGRGSLASGSASGTNKGLCFLYLRSRRFAFATVSGWCYEEHLLKTPGAERLFSTKKQDRVLLPWLKKTHLKRFGRRSIDSL